MRAEEAEVARRLPIFNGVSQENVDAILKASYLQRFPAHVELLREGDPADFLHVVVDGQIEVYSAHAGHETTVSVLGYGQSFIVAAVVLDRIYLKSARAMTPCRILLVPAETVRHYFAQDPGFARALATELALAYRGVVKELKNLKLRSSLERLANWILFHDMAAGETGRFTIPYDKRVLASRLGMAPAVLSRSFAALASCGVKVSGPEIVLRDRPALRRLANPLQTIDDPAI